MYMCLVISSVVNYTDKRLCQGVSDFIQFVVSLYSTQPDATDYKSNLEIYMSLYLESFVPIKPFTKGHMRKCKHWTTKSQYENVEN